MVLDRLYAVDRFTPFHILSDNQFMMSFLCKMQLRLINSSLVKVNLDVIYFGGFLFDYLIFIYFC